MEISAGPALGTTNKSFPDRAKRGGLASFDAHNEWLNLVSKELLVIFCPNQFIIRIQSSWSSFLYERPERQEIKLFRLNQDTSILRGSPSKGFDLKPAEGKRQSISF
jgi:hypothetical protein